MSMQVNALVFRKDVAKSSTAYTDWVLCSGYRKISVSVKGATAVQTTCDIECTSASLADTNSGSDGTPDAASVYNIGNQIVGTGTWVTQPNVDICSKWVRVKIVRGADAGVDPAQVAVVVSLRD